MINEHARKLKEEIEGFEDLDSEIEKKQAEYNGIREILIERAMILSESRKEVIDDLKKEVVGEMADLGFKSILFEPRYKLLEDSDGLEIKALSK